MDPVLLLLGILSILIALVRHEHHRRHRRDVEQLKQRVNYLEAQLNGTLSNSDTDPYASGSAFEEEAPDPVARALEAHPLRSEVDELRRNMRIR